MPHRRSPGEGNADVPVPRTWLGRGRPTTDGTGVRRIIYCSQATADLSPDELVGLLTQARENNQRAGLTGMLIYCSESFLQMLEGEPETVTATLERIRHDDRHEELRLLMDAESPERLFPDWSMGFDHLDEDRLSAELEGYVPETVHPLVNPDLVTNGAVAQRLLTLYADNRASA
jgi:hypothetical protein